MTEQEQLRLAILRILDANPSLWGLDEDVLHQMVRSQGLFCLPRHVRAELLYLRDRGLVEPADRPTSPSGRYWRITAAGRDFYESLTA